MLYSSCLCKWSIFTMLLDESYHSPFLEDDSTSNLNNVEHFVCTRIISYHSPFFSRWFIMQKKKLYLEFYSFSLFFHFPFLSFFFLFSSSSFFTFFFFSFFYSIFFPNILFHRFFFLFNKYKKKNKKT